MVPIKGNILKWIAIVIFYSRILIMVNYIANRFEFRIREKTDKTKNSFLFIRRRRYKNFQILIYHRVNDDNDPFLPSLPVHVFEKQMAYVADHFRVIPLEAVLERMRIGDLPDNTLTITFDDGYQDNYHNAFPILNKFSLPGTIFLTTGCIDSDDILWHDGVAQAFRQTSLPFLKWQERKYPLLTTLEKVSAFNEIMQSLRRMENSERISSIRILMDRLNVDDQNHPHHLMLTWDQIREMQNNRISFGAHTVTHPILNRLSSKCIKDEIVKSRMAIESVLRIPVRLFAYPNGRRDDFNEEVIRILKKEAFAGAVTTIHGINTVETGPFELLRSTPWDRYLPLFAARLNWWRFFS